MNDDEKLKRLKEAIKEQAELKGEVINEVIANIRAQEILRDKKKRGVD